MNVMSMMSGGGGCSLCLSILTVNGFLQYVHAKKIRLVCRVTRWLK